jgi:hypothetical protein
MLPPMGAPGGRPATRRRPATQATGTRAAGRRLPALVLLWAVVLAGCQAPGRGEAPAGLATSRAERASWPGPPDGAVAAQVQRVTDGDTFVAEVAGRRERSG